MDVNWEEIKVKECLSNIDRNRERYEFALQTLQDVIKI